jgi:hypothetical protein
MSTPHAGADTVLPGRLDTQRVGHSGMSFGGATAASFCATHTRCAAGMNLDGLLYGSAGREPLARPYFFASSADNAPLHRLFGERATAPAWLLTVRGSAHMDYTDFSWVAPRLGQRAGMLGGIAPARMSDIMNATAIPYFEAALRGGAEIDASALAARFPEATLVSHGARTPAVVTAPGASTPARGATDDRSGGGTR